MSSPLLSMRGIGKRFPGVIALNNVNLDIGQGEVVALCGENGAGKSTMMKILGGVYQPDAGEILVDGVVVKISNVTDSMKLRIAFIHQELNVLDNLDVAANVFLGREPKNALGLIDFKKIHDDTEPLLRRLGLDISSRTPLEKLSLAQKQMVEIAKALSLNSRIIIMDEPTSSLTLSETDRLLELVLELKKSGVSVVYISHRLGEVNHIADRVVVLRDGKNAGALNRAEINHDSIVSLMVGREIKSFYTASGVAKTPGFFKVRNARSGRYPARTVEFDVARGEILGFAGLVGAGRSEIVKAMVGLDKHGSAEVTIGDERIFIKSSADAIGHGIYLVPEDRRGEGLVTGMSVRENTTLPSLKKYSTFNLISRERERKVTDEQIKSLNIRTPGGETLVLNLSGGNQQKVVLGKWLSMNPKVMILDEPTRGIDVGAKAEIYRLMRELADRGGVILMISSDMEEVLNVSDRVAVMHEGRITGILERADCTEENVMNLAVGKNIERAKAAIGKSEAKPAINMNETPSIYYAGFGQRAAAFVVDVIIQVIASGIILYFLNLQLFMNAPASQEKALMITLISFGIRCLLGWIYFAAMESSPLQATLGKMALGIKVTNLTGMRISFGQATGRWFGKWVSSLILGIGWLMAAFTIRKQALHDIMAGTLVVRK